MRIKRLFLIPLFLIAAAFSLPAQTPDITVQESGESAGALSAETPVPDAGQNINTQVQNAPVENAGTEYIIREMKFDISGRTRPYYIISTGEFKEGERIKGKETLDRYLARKRQLLINQRVLEEVSIKYTLGKPEPDGALPVTLNVYIKDSWNFIIVPYPKYDSNDGFSVTLKARDYNFLGTMNPIRLDLGYRYDSPEHHFNFMLDSDTPFQALGLDWNINFDHTFEYTLGDPLYYQNVTGLWVKLPWRGTTFNVGFTQYLTLNEKIADENKDYNRGKDFYDFYGASELSTSWSIPLGIEVGEFGEITYTPGVSGKINYPYGSMDEPRKPVTSFNHSIGFGRTDLIGNFRKGLSASLGNGYSWYFDRSDAPLRITLTADAAVHWPFSKYFGVSSRLNYRHFWQWSDLANGWRPYWTAGDTIRGVVDEDIRADYMLSFNVELPIRALRFWPSELFNNRKLHLFDFEIFFSPFTDMALLQGPYSALKANRNEGTRFSFDDMIATTGLEVIVFSGFFRSLRLRGSVGYNIKEIKENGLELKWGFFPQWDEIYIGLDYFY